MKTEVTYTIKANYNNSYPTYHSEFIEDLIKDINLYIEELQVDFEEKYSVMIEVESSIITK